MDLAHTEPIRWRCQSRIEKYHTPNGESIEGLQPYEVIDSEGNLLVFGGASALWERLIGTGVTAFDNTNAFLGVGDSSAAAANTQTDLQAASNKLRKAMDSTYPQHTDGTGSSGNASIVYKSTFANADANFAWQEWAVFNASTAGRMLNRKVESHGTKASGDTWALTVTLSLA